jgi:hypothetical protein
MVKISKIEVKNFKAVSETEMDFNGCSAIISAGNNKGKTTICRGLIDRMRGIKPSLVLKQGETDGFSNIQLTDGSRIEWKFTENSEHIAYITSDGLKVTSGIIRQIGEKYFGSLFNIDKFLLSSPKDQSQILGKLVGVDFEAIDLNYKIAYDNRTEKNRELKRLQALKVEAPLAIGEPTETDSEIVQQIADEKKRISENEIKYKAQYNELVNEYDKKFLEEIKKIEAFNKQQDEAQKVLNKHLETLEKINELLGPFKECFSVDAAQKIIEGLIIPKEHLTVDSINIEKPVYDFNNNSQKLDELDQKLQLIRQQKIRYDNYIKELAEFEESQKELAKASREASEADEKVKKIEAEKIEIIKSANIPEEFSFDENGILYNGFP